VDRLPLLISVPHAGLSIPPEVAHLNRLTPQEIAEDGDQGAQEIYAILETEVAQFVTTEIARAFVDLNRAEDDMSKDGVVKTYTCWDIRIYDEPLKPELIQRLLQRYYRPHHRRLSALARLDLVLGVDCHTMAAHGPPVGPDPGAVRPQICLGNADGTCAAEWMEGLRTCFQAHFPGRVTVNAPFAGGYITRRHGQEMPWVQLELSRGPFADNAKKSLWVLESLGAWTQLAGFSPRDV
jgi:N-formylglutamate amidohydrolase